jgi:peptidyl-prolyl cis-trans isomerase D
MRNGFFSAIFLGLLVLGGFSLVLTDWNGMFRDGGVTKTDIAVVNGTPIKISEFNNIANRVLRNQRINAAQAYESGMLDNILQNEILTRVLALAANDYGIRVEDKHIAKQIKSLISPLMNDQTNDKQALKQFLQMQGMNEKNLISIIRSEIETELLKSSIAANSYVPRILSEDISSYQDTTRAVRFIEIKNEDIKLDKQADEQTLKDYYESVKTQYMVPETRDFTIAVMNAHDLVADTKITDEEIQTYYDAHKEDYQEDEKRVLDQAIIQNEGDALSIIEKVKSGQDFEETIKNMTGSTKTYAKAISFAAKDLSTDMSKPVFAAQKSDIVGPFKSPLGYHVIKIADIKEPRTKPLAELKDAITKELTDQKVGDEIYALTSSFEDRLAAGEDYEALKNEFKIKTYAFKNVSIDTKKIGEVNIFTEEQTKTILNKIFQMGDEEPSSLSDLSATEMFSAKVDKITTETPKAYSDIKDMIAKRWKSENQARQNLISAQLLTEKLNDGTTTLHKSGYKVQEISKLARPGSSIKSPDNIPVSFKDIRVSTRFMDAEEGKYIISIPSDAESVIVGVVDKTSLGTPNKGEIDTLVKSLKADISTANLMLFVTQLEKEYPVEINQALIKRLYANSGDQEE